MADEHGRDRVAEILNAKLAELKAINEKLVVTYLQTRELLDEMGRRRSELGASHRRLRSIVTSMQEEIWYCDRQRRVTPMTPTAVEVLGRDYNAESSVSIDEWVGQLRIRAMDGHILAPEETPLLRSLSGETLTQVQEMVDDPRGNAVQVREVNSAPVRDEDGEITGAVAVVRCIA